jgi:hypothetical protein
MLVEYVGKNRSQDQCIKNGLTIGMKHLTLIIVHDGNIPA